MGQMSLTRCLNLGLQALFLLVFALVMAQKMRGPQVRKFTPGHHVVEVEESEPVKGEATATANSAGTSGSDLIVTDPSLIEPFAPYDAVPKAIAAQGDDAQQVNSGDTEDHWDRQLKKFENHCTVPKLNL